MHIRVSWYVPNERSRQSYLNQRSVFCLTGQGSIRYWYGVLVRLLRPGALGTLVLPNPAWDSGPALDLATEDMSSPPFSQDPHHSFPPSILRNSVTHRELFRDTVPQEAVAIRKLQWNICMIFVVIVFLKPRSEYGSHSAGLSLTKYD